MRILQAPSNIANQAWSIAEGLRALGHEVEVWHYGPNKFSYPADRAVPFPPEKPVDLWRLIERALQTFDVFHFHYARSLVPRQVGTIPGLWDLPLYGGAGKPAFFTFHGSDVRLRTEHMEADRWSYFRFADVPCDEDDIRKRLEIIRTYAAGMWVCSPVNRRLVPDAGFHPRALLVAEWPFVGPVNREVPVVVHAPSRRSTKGSDIVLREVEKAQERGLKFEFRVLEGLSHAGLRDALSKADVLVDNLLLGDYEVTGLEALCMGKTVITRLTDPVFAQMGEVPILSADPDTFGEVLERAVTDHRLRESLAEAGRGFVERHHDAKIVADKILTGYRSPAKPPALSFPGWASIGGSRGEERLERQVTELRTALRSRGREVVVSGTRRGPFTRIGSAIDAVLRRLVRRGRPGAA